MGLEYEVRTYRGKPWGEVSVIDCWKRNPESLEYASDWYRQHQQGHDFIKYEPRNPNAS